MDKKQFGVNMAAQIISGLGADNSVVVGDVYQSLFAMGQYLDCLDSLQLGIGCGECSSEDRNARPSIGQMPSGVGSGENSVQPLDAPTTSAIMDKIDTQSKAKAMNAVLHAFWKILDARAAHETALSKEKVVVAHTALVDKMKKRGWLHQYLDKLDDTLPVHLRTIVGPEAPEKKHGDDSTEREPITVAAPDNEQGVSFSGAMHVALPEVQISTSSCVQLKADGAKKFLGKSEQIAPDLPDDALFLVIDAVETGTFNKVEISKEELERAAPDYAGRMFVEGHEWNDPSKAIGQVLKAKVVFNPTKGKWVMQVLAVVLREDAIKNFERGLYKFVSIGATMKAICTVCGLTVQDGCRHMKGMVYETPSGKVECKYRASELQMEELSAVNVPACRTAGAQGRVTKEQARDLLAASLEKGCGEQLLSLEAAIDLQEIIYRNESMQLKGDRQSMAKWQEEFRISDAQGYNSLLQRAENYPLLSRTYGDLLGHRKVPQEADGLLFAHELLHRWFNQPNRAKGWSEEEIVGKHDEVMAALVNMSVEHPVVSVMDAVLHAKCRHEAKENFEPGEKAIPGAELPEPNLPPEQPKPGAATEIEQPSIPEDEVQPALTKMPIRNAATQKYGDEKCEKCGELKNKCSCQSATGANCEAKDKNNHCYDTATLKSEKVLNQTDEKNNTDDDMDNAKSEKELDAGEEIEVEAVSLSDAETRRAGYQDGVAKSQAGATKAQGKDMNIGADIPVKGADYKKGYQQGYKEAEKSREPNYVNEQISKGGVKMAVENNTEPVVLEKSKDEAKKTGAIKDFGTRKEQGEAKAPVQYADKEDLGEPRTDGSNKVETNAVHDYDAKKGEAKPEVRYEKPNQDGDVYGMLKCPKCNQGNIMGDSPKCPKCGAPHSDLIPIKEEERMGDFPYQKQHSAFDAPPMEAKTPGVPTPAAQKSKLSGDDESVTKFMAESQNELRLVKEHLGKITVQFEAERGSWYAERRELICSNQSLGEKLDSVQEELETVKLDLNTKSSMYKTLLEEHQGLMKRLDEHARMEKREIVSEIINSNVKLGLLAETEREAELQRYMEKPIETLRVLHEEVTKNTKRIADMMLSKKFGVPVEGKETTEQGKVTKGAAVENIGEAKAKAKQADELEKADEKAGEDVEEADKMLSGATKDSNTIYAQVCRSLKNNRRNR